MGSSILTRGFEEKASVGSDQRKVLIKRLGVLGADGLGSMKACSENQIQLIGIEAREFDDLADLETERPFYRTQSLTRLARCGFEDLARSLTS